MAILVLLHKAQSRGLCYLMTPGFSKDIQCHV